MNAAFLICLSLTGEVPEPPRLASRPEAPISLYLDFDGHRMASWGKHTNVVSAPFVLDSERRTRDGIIEIWERVSEDYIPFNVNVTTIEPRDSSQTARIVIGGHTSAWYGYRANDGRSYGYNASGVSMQDGFKDHSNHIGFVFSENLKSFGPQWTKAIAESASHEAGHLFGVRHLPARNQSGAVVETYNRGTRKWGPIMGIGFYTERSLWHKDYNELGQMQDDVKILADTLGRAPDDFADEPIWSLPIVNNPVDINGAIEHADDVDLFHFRTDSGRVILRLESPCAGPNLKAELELRSDKASCGKIETGGTLDVDIQRGVHYISIKPLPGYGNLGRYRVTGELPHMAMRWTLLGSEHQQVGPPGEGRPNE